MKTVLLVSALVLVSVVGSDAWAQDTTAPAGSAAAGAGTAKPKAGAAKRKPGKPGPADAAAVSDAPPPPPKKGAKPAATKPGKPAPEASAPVASGGAPRSHEVVERESHIEFDERLVHGQTAAGAIYLFQRAPSEFKSVVQPPDSFRARTTTLLASDRAPP